MFQKQPTGDIHGGSELKLAASTIIMKREIANYIEKLLVTGKSLTDSQVRIIAYWELVDFHSDVDESSQRCRDALNKFLEDYNDEMSLVV